MKTRFCAKLTKIAAFVAFGLSPISSSADWADDFLNEAGGAVSITSGRAITTNRISGRTFGNLVWRHPTKDFHPLSVIPPGYSAGCGGIDLFLGGYSFPNKDEFIQALRNFGQASLGYFFQIALRSMAPELAVTLEAINDIASKINQFGMHTCQDAMKFAQFTADAMGMEKRAASSAWVSAMGTAVDYVDAVTSFKSKKEQYENTYKQKYGKTESAMTQADVVKNQPMVKGNIVYAALIRTKNPIIEDQIPIIMALVGTEIYTTEKDSTGNDIKEVLDPRPSLISFRDLFITDAGTDVIKVYRCNSGSDPECLRPVEDTASFVGFKKRAEKAAEEIRNNVAMRVDSGLSAQTTTILKLSSVPLHRAASFAATPGLLGVASFTLSNELADYAGLDAAVNFVLTNLNTIERAMAQLKDDGTLQPLIKNMNERIQLVRKNMMDEIAEIYGKNGKPYEKLAELEHIERTMMANLDSSLVANYKFKARNK